MKLIGKVIKQTKTHIKLLITVSNYLKKYKIIRKKCFNINYKNKRQELNLNDLILLDLHTNKIKLLK